MGRPMHKHGHKAKSFSAGLLCWEVENKPPLASSVYLIHTKAVQSIWPAVICFHTLVSFGDIYGR